MQCDDIDAFYFQKSIKKRICNICETKKFNIFYFSNPKMYLMYVRKKMFNVFSFSNPKTF